MRRHIVTGLTTAAMAAAAIAPAAAQEARVYKPTGQWALDYGDDYCRLMRTFGDGKNELSLAFERIEPGPTMRMILVGDGVRIFRGAEMLGWNFSASAGSERMARYAQSKTADKKDYINFGPVTVAPFAPQTPTTAYDRAAEKAAAKPFTAITVGSGLSEPIRVDTGSLEAPVGALQACADDLARSWGLDPATLPGSTPAAPEGGGAGWLPQGTIPFEEFGRFAGGSNQVRLMVDAAGKPTSCHIHWPTLSEMTNKKVCSTLLEKARFAPAKDAQGRAMAGFWVGSPLFLGPPMPGMRRGG
ncbi:MAG: hypothetical protein ACO1OD_05395 [Croceibacterium sp.]